MAISYSIIQKSQLEGAHRLDAEYYQPEYFIDFTKGRWASIGGCLKTCQYGLSKAMNDERVGYPIYKMDDISYGFLFDDKLRYVAISDKEAKPYLIRENDIFFNRVNAEEFVGRTGIFKKGPKSVFASYLIRLQVRDDSKISADYLNVFLNSKYGKRQIQKHARRAVNQANVNAEELKKFKIAILPNKAQEEIKRLSGEAWQSFENSKSLYTQAENLLLEELGLKDFELEDTLSYSANFSDVKSANRLDAEYFQPKYDVLLKKLRKREIRPLPEMIKAVTHNFSPAKQPDTKFQYIELANINPSLGVIDGSSEVQGGEAPSRARRKLKTGDVIISSVEGSFEKVALVDEENGGGVASTGFFQFRSDEILPEVILVLARSMVLQEQFKKHAAGTILTAVPRDALQQMILPVIPRETQQKIAELVRQSHEARKKAKELLEEAKHKVEELIEKGNQ